MTKRTIVAVFLALAFILLCGTIFHWIYRQKAVAIRNRRIKNAYDLARTVSINAHNGLSVNKVYPKLLHAFRRGQDIVLMVLTDVKGKPILLKTRVKAALASVYMNKILLQEPLSTIIPDGIVRDRRKKPSSFHYSVGLDRQNRGSLIVLYNPLSYRNNRSVNIRRFVTATVVILLFTMLYLMIMNQVRRTVDDREIHPAVLQQTDSNRDLEYLKTRNSLLEKEVESLSSLQEKSLTASSAATAADLIDHLKKSLSESFGNIRIRIFIDRTHSVRSLSTLEGRARSLEKKTLRSILEFLPNIELQNSSKMAFPLTAGKTTYGIIVVRKRDLREQFNDTDAYNASRLVSQQAVPLYNFLLYETAVTDSLTGLYNRRHFDTRVKEEIERSIRYKSNLTLVMIDIDYFKKINDTYGHTVGDNVLRMVSDLIRNAIRKTDYAFRYGGEEIAVLMPETEPEDAAYAMELLRKTLSESDFTSSDGVVFRITCSFGVSSSDGKNITEPTGLIRAADSALYASKRNGRNMVSRNTGKTV